MSTCIADSEGCLDCSLVGVTVYRVIAPLARAFLGVGTEPRCEGGRADSTPCAALKALCGVIVESDVFGVYLTGILVYGDVETLGQLHRQTESASQLLRVPHVLLHLGVMLELRFLDTEVAYFLKTVVLVRLHLDETNKLGSKALMQRHRFPQIRE